MCCLWNILRCPAQLNYFSVCCTSEIFQGVLHIWYILRWVCERGDGHIWSVLKNIVYLNYFDGCCTFKIIGGMLKFFKVVYTAFEIFQGGVPSVSNISRCCLNGPPYLPSTPVTCGHVRQTWILPPLALTGHRIHRPTFPGLLHLELLLKFYFSCKLAGNNQGPLVITKHLPHGVESPCSNCTKW